VAPAALAIISTTFEEGRERGFAMGVWTAVAAGGGAAGLVLGGFALSGLSLLALLFGQRMAKDYAGAGALVPYFLVCLAGLFALHG